MTTRPELSEQRRYLDEHNGLTGLELVDPTDVERAVRIFRRDGFVVVRDVLDAEETAALRRASAEAVKAILAAEAEADDRAAGRGNRGRGRYSFGGSSLTRSMLHLAEWRMLVDHPRLTPLVTAIFESADYVVRSGSGDFCLPGTTDYQVLHSDMRGYRPSAPSPFSSFHDPRGILSTRELPCPYVCANVLVDDQTRLNGPTRQIPGSQHSRASSPSLEDEPEWMRLSTVCPAPAGSVQLRDVRAWHGGTPNVSDDVRMIPNIEFYAPWFREPTEPCMTSDQWAELSEHGRRITRHLVAHPGEELEFGYRVQQLHQQR